MNKDRKNNRHFNNRNNRRDDRRNEDRRNDDRRNDERRFDDNRRRDRNDRHQRHDNRRFDPVTIEQIRASEEAIKVFKSQNQPVCEKCGQVITDLSTAITNKATGNPVHFDCVLKELQATETLEDGDRLTYIGQGRFGVVNFPNIHDMKHFTIKKIIEWEDREKKGEWRNQMAELYSQVK
ncbi:hypothetical protein [Treponema sp.]|uniref:hypothetical protein n=1 Tax=Treponema sp. TaxID=166 RepID=UPI0026007146|nr:hypothetical protein [Treponema sp.]MCR5218150.1 hypothetical protein [Treponema sp.]